MKLKAIFTLALMLMTGTTVKAEDKGQEFISQLMAKMTVEEKLGQLNLLPGTSATTGELKNSPLMRLVEQGKLGSILNQTGADGIRQLQEAAVKKSRLGIPLLIGMDVVHGYQTIFPIPLAMSCSWDLKAIEQSARIAAKEATADGISWTYSPMVDVALDARWGRIAEGSGEDPFLGLRIREHDGLHQALCPVWRCRGRSRLQHGRYESPQDVQPVFSALRGCSKGRSRVGDDLV